MNDQAPNPLHDLPVGSVADVSPDGFNWWPAIRTADGWLANVKPEEVEGRPDLVVAATGVHTWPVEELAFAKPYTRAAVAEAGVADLKARLDALAAENAAIKDALDVPDQTEFLEAAVAEAQYQRTRWSEQDATKTPSDWFWLVGYLVSKAMHDVRGKRVHHLVAAAAVLANWHKASIAAGEAMPDERGDQADHTGRI